MRSRCSSTYCRSPASPHQRVGTEGSRSSSPSRLRHRPAETCDERRRLDRARSERVGDRHVARARGFHEPGNAERRIGAQLQRIAVAVVESPEDDVDRLQAIERLDEDAPIAHGQVATLDEREAEIARQVRVLEVGLVERTGREQHDARRVALARSPAPSACRAAPRRTTPAAATWQSRNASGRLRDRTMRFSSVYPAPDGACVRSASTHH